MRAVEQREHAVDGFGKDIESALADHETDIGFHSGQLASGAYAEISTARKAQPVVGQSSAFVQRGQRPSALLLSRKGVATASPGRAIPPGAEQKCIANESPSRTALIPAGRRRLAPMPIVTFALLDGSGVGLITDVESHSLATPYADRLKVDVEVTGETSLRDALEAVV
jgi:hypothetical protein